MKYEIRNDYFLLRIYNENDMLIFGQSINGFWVIKEYNQNDYVIHTENSDGLKHIVE